MFIAPSYTTYQLKSIEFNDLAFELWKVTKFSNDTVLYDPINVSENKASIKEVSSALPNNEKAKVNREIKKYTVDDVFISFDLEKGANLQEVYMLYDDYFCSGEIYKNTFCSDDTYIYSFYTDCPYSSLKSSLKSLMGSEVLVTILGIELYVLSDIDIDVSVYDLGFSQLNYS